MSEQVATPQASRASEPNGTEGLRCQRCQGVGIIALDDEDCRPYDPTGLDKLPERYVKVCPECFLGPASEPTPDPYAAGYRKDSK